MGIYVVRAFVRLSQAAVLHADLARRLDELEEKADAVALSHDTFIRNTPAQPKQVFDALSELMAPPDPPIGFVTPEDKSKKAARAKGMA